MHAANVTFLSIAVAFSISSEHNSLARHTFDDAGVRFPSLT